MRWHAAVLGERKPTTNSPDVRKVVGLEVIGNKHTKTC